MIDTPNKNYLSNDVVIKGSIKYPLGFFNRDVIGHCGTVLRASQP